MECLNAYTMYLFAHVLRCGDQSDFACFCVTVETSPPKDEDIVAADVAAVRQGTSNNDNVFLTHRR